MLKNGADPGREMTVMRHRKEALSDSMQGAPACDGAVQSQIACALSDFWRSGGYCLAMQFLQSAIVASLRWIRAASKYRPFILQSSYLSFGHYISCRLSFQVHADCTPQAATNSNSIHLSSTEIPLATFRLPFRDNCNGISGLEDVSTP
jgi:hypothetical protein